MMKKSINKQFIMNSTTLSTWYQIIYLLVSHTPKTNPYSTITIYYGIKTQSSSIPIR